MNSLACLFLIEMSVVKTAEEFYNHLRIVSPHDLRLEIL
jgi:hypothetical protein